MHACYAQMHAVEFLCLTIVNTNFNDHSSQYQTQRGFRSWAGIKIGNELKNMKMKSIKRYFKKSVMNDLLPNENELKV